MNRAKLERIASYDGVVRIDASELRELLAACRERDALLEVVEAAEQMEARAAEYGMHANYHPVSDLETALVGLLQALAQHRGEADRGRDDE